MIKTIIIHDLIVDTMVIKSKKELQFAIAADRIMNGKEPEGLINLLKERLLAGGGYYLYLMRKCSYYNYRRKGSFLFGLIYLFYHLKYIKLGQKLSIYIEYDSMGYGVVLPHLGSIVIGSNEIGDYAVIFQDTTISGNHKKIGDGLYLSAGAKITKKVVLGDNVSVSANSVVLQSCGDNVLLAGMPAVVKKTDYPAWYVRDGFLDKVDRVESLKLRMFK